MKSKVKEEEEKVGLLTRRRFKRVGEVRARVQWYERHPGRRVLGGGCWGVEYNGRYIRNARRASVVDTSARRSAAGPGGLAVEKFDKSWGWGDDRLWFIGERSWTKSKFANTSAYTSNALELYTLILLKKDQWCNSCVTASFFQCIIIN